MDKKVPLSVSLRSSLSDALKERANEYQQSISNIVERLLYTAIEQENQLAEIAEKDRIIEGLIAEKEKADKVARLSFAQLQEAKKMLSEFVN